MTIASSIQGFGKWLFNIKDDVKLRYPLDEELIRREEVIKAQQKQIHGRDAQLAKRYAQDREKEEQDSSEEYQKVIAHKLQEQGKKIRSNKFKHTFSLRYFMNKCGTEKKPTKFAKAIDVTDKDDSTNFGKFGDILIADNGYFLLTDVNGVILGMAKDITQLIWKPDGLENYMKRKRIPLAVDSELNSVPDLEEEEHPDVMYDQEEDEYRETETRMRPVKEMLIERDEKLREMHRYTERMEKMNIDKDHKINSLNRALKLLENRSNLSQTELSSVLDKAMQFETKVGDMQSKIIKLSEIKTYLESSSDRHQYIIKNLLDKLEKHGDKTMQEWVKAETKDDINFYKGILPEVTIEKEVPEVQQQGDKKI